MKENVVISLQSDSSLFQGQRFRQKKNLKKDWATSVNSKKPPVYVHSNNSLSALNIDDLTS